MLDIDSYVRVGLGLYIYHPSRNKWCLYNGLVTSLRSDMVIDKARPIFGQVSYANLVSYRDSRIIFIGGYQPAKRCASSKVFTYQISADKWSDQAPELNKERFYHSSLVLGDSIYVCGGQGTLDDDSLLNCIEKLEDVGNITDGRARWVTLDIRTPQTMKNFLMIPIAADEILFLGGRTGAGTSPFINPVVLTLNAD